MADARRRKPPAAAHQSPSPPSARIGGVAERRRDPAGRQLSRRPSRPSQDRRGAVQVVSPGGSTGIGVILGTSGGTSWASPVYTLADELTIDWINPAISSGTTLLGSAPSTAMKARLGFDSRDDGEDAGVGVAETEGQDVGPALPGRVRQASVGRLPPLGVVGRAAVGNEDHRRPVPAVAAGAAGVVVGLDHLPQVVERGRVRRAALGAELGHGLHQAQIAQRQHGVRHVAEGDTPNRITSAMAGSSPMLARSNGSCWLTLSSGAPGHGGRHVQAEVEGEDRVALLDADVCRSSSASSYRPATVLSLQIPRTGETIIADHEQSDQGQHQVDGHAGRQPAGPSLRWPEVHSDRMHLAVQRRPPDSGLGQMSPGLGGHRRGRGGRSSPGPRCGRARCRGGDDSPGAGAPGAGENPPPAGPAPGQADPGAGAADPDPDGNPPAAVPAAEAGREAASEADRPRRTGGLSPAPRRGPARPEGDIRFGAGRGRAATGRMVTSGGERPRVGSATGGDGAPPPWAAQTARIRAAAPRASSTASSGANQAAAGGRQAGSDTSRPRSHRSHRRRRARAGHPRSGPGRHGEVDRDRPTLPLPGLDREVGGADDAQEDQRQRVAVRRQGRIAPAATAGSSQLGVMARRRPAGRRATAVGVEVLAVVAVDDEHLGAALQRPQHVLGRQVAMADRGAAVSNASSTRARA